jgi:hypothetical protein
LANERRETFVGNESGRSEVQKLLDAAKWVADHLAEVLAHEGVEPRDLASWRIRPLMVVDAELMTPFIDQLPVEVVTLHELKENTLGTNAADGGLQSPARKNENS